MHPTCLNGKACGHNDPLCLISLPLCFSAGLFLGVPQKGRRKENNCYHGARRHHVCTAAKAFDASSSNEQTRSISNTGTPHHMAALLTDTSVPIVRRKEVADFCLSPGVSAGRSETAPGISTVTRSAWATVPQGFPPHRLSPVVRLCRGVGGSRSRMRQAEVTSVITHLASLDCYTPE